MTAAATDADWMVALREHVQRTNQGRVAQKLGVSASVVSAVLSGSYRADTRRIERRVRGALMGEFVECPVLWDLPTHRCQDLQERKGPIANERQQQAWYCCRGAGRYEDSGPCPHFNGAGSRAAGAASSEDTDDTGEAE